ncbi:MarR family winged helix-turn-helix transcriptional regulator [Microbacterium sp. NPDC091313]
MTSSASPSAGADPAGGGGASTPAEERSDAIRSLESSFSELIGVFRRMMTQAAETASPGMLPGTFKVLSHLNRLGPATLSVLSERLEADKGLISRSVSELEGLGFVERTADPDDRRSRVIAVTPLGQERLEAAREPHAGRLRESLVDWSTSDIHHAAALLHALASGTAPAQRHPEA